MDEPKSYPGPPSTRRCWRGLASQAGRYSLAGVFPRVRRALDMLAADGFLTKAAEERGH